MREGKSDDIWEFRFTFMISLALSYARNLFSHSFHHTTIIFDISIQYMKQKVRRCFSLHILVLSWRIIRVPSSTDCFSKLHSKLLKFFVVGNLIWISSSSGELFLGSNLQDNYSFLAYYPRWVSCIRHLLQPPTLSYGQPHSYSGIISIRGSLLSQEK